MIVGIVPTINHDNLVTITIHLVFFMSWIVAPAAYSTVDVDRDGVGFVILLSRTKLLY